MLNAWRALLYAHARATQRVDAALSAAGLPPLTWYDVLWALRRAPRRRLRTGALAEEVTLSRTGLTRLIDRIERAGLLRREPVPEDRRGSFVAITREGTAMLRKMWPIYEQVLDLSFAAEVRDPRTLRRTLEAVGR
jgi:DNA-binding MarR family transcriptional regulator